MELQGIRLLSGRTYKKLKIEDKKTYNIMVNSGPKRGVLEEIGNSITHGVGALLGVLCLIFLLSKSNSKIEIKLMYES